MPSVQYKRNRCPAYSGFRRNLFHTDHKTKPLFPLTYVNYNQKKRKRKGGFSKKAKKLVKK